MQNLGWTLVHFVWQGAVLAILLYLAIGFSRSSRVRYGAAVCALALMALAPIATFAFLERRPEVTLQLSTVMDALRPVHALANSPSGPIGIAPATPPIDWLSYFVWAWSCGVLVFSLRALGGWFVVGRLHRSHRGGLPQILLARCRALQRNLGISQAIRYFESKLVDTPAVMGWFRPIVLIPASALTGLSTGQLEAVIMHELAHIKRLDSFVNLFQIAIETLLFYHPAVWWVSRVVRSERENCCDDIAVAMSGDAGEYARALALLEASRVTPVWALAANGGALKARIGRLLGLQTITRSMPAAGLAVIGVLCAAGALFASTAFSQASMYQPQFEVAPTAPAAPATPAPPSARLASVAPSSPVPAAATTPAEAPEAAPAPQTAATPEPPHPPAAAGSYIDDLQSAGIKAISVHDLIELKIHGVTGEYVRAVHAAGLDPSIHEFVEMKIQGVEPEYIRDMRAAGLSPALHDLIEMRIQGVTPEYVRQVRAGGWTDLSAHRLIEMKIQGVNPAEAVEFRQLGLDDLSLNRLIELRVQGVSPNYVRSLQAAGFRDLKTRDYIEAKIQGVSPEFVERVRSHGFKDLTLRQLIQLKIAGVF
jgi:beta-lactamase regulating signal transducer with metallopeptidase domain